MTRRVREILEAVVYGQRVKHDGERAFVLLPTILIDAAFRVLAADDKDRAESDKGGGRIKGNNP